MGANTCTGSTATGTITGTDPTFKVTYKANNDEGVFLYLKYVKGTETHITLTFECINPSLHATDEYYHVSLAGTALGVFTMVISASGNYRIPVPVSASEKTVIANIVFSSATQSGAVVANFMAS